MNNRILIIDDSTEFCSDLAAQLNGEFEVDRAHNGQEGLSMATTNDYIVILFDLVTPDTDGFDFLKQLKENERLKSTSVVCVSVKDDDDTVIECFNLGAEEFISKNTNIEIVAKKTRNLVRFKQRVVKMEVDGDELTELVNTTMTQASFYGSCINLISELQLLHSERELADCIFNFMKQFNFHTAISFHAPSRLLEYDQQTFYCSPLEHRVFEVLKDKGRIYEFGRRAIFNSDTTSLLVKNMPVKDSTEYGLLIDVFAKLVPSLDQCFKGLLNNRNLENTQQRLKDTVQDIQSAVVELQEDRQRMMDNIILEIGISFHEYEFTDKQEDFLQNLIEKNVQEQANNSEQFVGINHRLTNIIEQIEESRKQIMTSENKGVIDDIELF